MEERLLPVVLAERGIRKDAELVWGFPIDREMVEWDEDRVCFRCDRTTGSGSLHRNMWFCDRCWVVVFMAGGRMFDDTRRQYVAGSD